MTEKHKEILLPWTAMGQEPSKVKFPLQNSDGWSSAWKLSDIRAQFERRQQLGPNYGYFPESSKSILVVVPHNVEHKVEFAGLNFQVETGSRYHGNFIGETMEETAGSQTK